jgi:hypothetical protein
MTFFFFSFSLIITRIDIKTTIIIIIITIYFFDYLLLLECILYTLDTIIGPIYIHNCSIFL